MTKHLLILVQGSNYGSNKKYERDKKCKHLLEIDQVFKTNSLLKNNFHFN